MDSDHHTTAAELEAAFENLYAVFARYKVRGPVEGCPCCVTVGMMAGIANQPLREMTHDDLYLFSQKAMTTWGGVDHFRHFLPRLCELICDPRDDRLHSVAFDFLCMKLDHARWKEWPAEEREAVMRFFLAMWRKVAIHGCADDTMVSGSMDTYSCLLYCRPDFTPLIDACVRSLTPSSLQFLKELALWKTSFNHRQFVAATQASHWDGMRADEPGLLEALLSPATIQRLEAEFFDEHGSLDKSDVSATIDAIERLRSMVTSAT